MFHCNNELYSAVLRGLFPRGTTKGEGAAMRSGFWNADGFLGVGVVTGAPEGLVGFLQRAFAKNPYT
jgi:hypothetical protein